MFAKVFSQILDSSLAENYQVRLVFEDLLKLAQPDGTVDITRESISRRTNVPLDIVTSGIEQLEQPDKSSRTPDHEGRRIVRLDAHRDWGWRIVNFIKYRESATREMLRMAEADRKKEWRKRKGFPHTPSQVQKEEEEEADMSHVCPGQSGTSPGHLSKRPAKPRFAPPSMDELKLSVSKAGLPETEAYAFFNYYSANGWKVGRNPMASWPHAVGNWAAKYRERNSSNGNSPRSKVVDQELDRELRRIETL